MVSNPDQVEVEAPSEADQNDVDSTMEDVGIIVDTPRTSLATVDSRGALEESTRASTPTEICAKDVPADLDSLKPPENDGDADDVPMKDCGLRKGSPARAADEYGNLKIVSWPLNSVIDPGSSPWEAGKSKEEFVEFVDYGSDRRKLEELLQTDDPDAPNLYKP